VPGAREVVEANMRALRKAATDHRMLVMSTSEANRGSYRSDEAIGASDDMAAGKDSSAIEYAAQILLMVRTPKGYPNHLRVYVPKNRRGITSRFEFYLRLDRERHSLTECADPTVGDAEHAAVEREHGKRRDAKARVVRDAKELAGVVRGSGGLGENELRAAVHVAGLSWGVNRLNAARAALAAGVNGERLINRRSGRRCGWFLERIVSEVSDTVSATHECVPASPLKGDADTDTSLEHPDTDTRES